MPIRKDLKPYYGESWTQIVRPRILLRAENKCEACGVPNHLIVLREAGWWTPYETRAALTLFSQRGKPGPHEIIELFWTPPTGDAGRFAGFPAFALRVVRIVLGVAHKNHQPGDDRDENLIALCQWCHLNFDKEHHRETRQDRKDQARPLLKFPP